MCLLELKTLLLLQRMLHDLLVFAAVSLSTQGMDGGTFAPVEHPVLDAGFVGSQRHLTAQCIQFSHQVTLSCAADGGVTGEVGNGIQIDGKQNGLQSQTGSGQRSFDACMTGTDDSNIAGACVVGGHSSSSVAVFFSTGGRTKGLQTTSQRLMGVPRLWNFSS